MKNDLIKSLKQQLETEKERSKNRRAYLKLTPAEFKEIFILNAGIELAKRNRDTDFLIDEQNKEIINQLYFYVVGSGNFKGDFKKGIVLMGSFGTGKTLIMLSCLNLIENVSSKIITRFHSKEIPFKIKEKEGEPDFYNTRPLFIDDIGKEPHIINSFGTKSSPISDLFALRYDFGAWTFATTNHSPEELLEFYGASTVDRFKEMFNMLVLTGASRR